MPSKNLSGEQRTPSSAGLFRFSFANSTSPEDRDRKSARFRRFLSYYRPPLPLLAAVLGCAVLVATTAIAMPIIVNRVVAGLPGLAASPDAVGQLLAIGAAMVAIFL